MAAASKVVSAMEKIAPYAAKAATQIPSVATELVNASVKAQFDRLETLKYLVDVSQEITERYLNLLEVVENKETEEIIAILDNETFSYEEKLEMCRQTKEFSLEKEKEFTKGLNTRTLIIAGEAVAGVLIGAVAAVKIIDIKTAGKVAIATAHSDAISMFSLAGVIKAIGEVCKTVMEK